jgi:beta-lactam-binding protein with PASTA domain
VEPTPEPTPVTVKNYQCLDFATARTQIEQADLRVGNVFPENTDDSWIVREQFPVAGEQVPPGSDVSLVLDPPNTACPPPPP